MSSELNNPPSTPPPASVGASRVVYPPNIHDMRDEKKKKKRKKEVRKKIKKKLKKKK